MFACALVGKTGLLDFERDAVQVGHLGEFQRKVGAVVVRQAVRDLGDVLVAEVAGG